MEKSYKVILLRLVKEEGYFKRQLLKFGVTEAVSEKIIKSAPVVLKQKLSLKDARIYADAIIQAGGKVTIQVENGLKENYANNAEAKERSFKDFIMCPECGFKQLKKEKCIRCGLKFDASIH